MQKQPMIAWTIYLTFGGAVLLLFMPRAFARWIALVTAAGGFAISLASFFCDEIEPANFATIARTPWVSMLGMEYHLAVDGISLTLALVTGLTAISAVLFRGTLTTGLTSSSSGSCSLSAVPTAFFSAPICFSFFSSTSWSSCRNISSSRSGDRPTRNTAR